ncbi:MAG: hypothetical protein LW707_07275 [Sphingobacteriales bacterium]|nr:hypothetical protein [Sphingobacteriales bacterium]
MFQKYGTLRLRFTTEVKSFSVMMDPRFDYNSPLENFRGAGFGALWTHKYLVGFDYAQPPVILFRSLLVLSAAKASAF